MIQFLLEYEYWPIALPIYILIGFGFWYLFYGLTFYLNGGTSGQGGVFRGFWEELQWHLPGGLAKRTEYIRTAIGPPGKYSGFMGHYSYEEIHMRNLYTEVAKDVLGKSWIFWLEFLLCVFWPALIVLWVAAGIIFYVYGVLRAIERSFQWNPHD